MISTDICIIGGGPGGLACAVAAALHGRQAVVVNAGSLMGYGIDGAFKSKVQFEITRHFVYASMRPEVFGDVPIPTLHSVLRGTDRAASGLESALVRRLERLGVKVISGRGRFVDAHTVAVGEERIRARNVVIATGSTPRIPAGVVATEGRILTSDTVHRLSDLPARTLVLGGGVIGCEYASIFAALGSDTALVDSQDRILAMEDPDLSAFVARTFERRDIEVIHSSRFQAMSLGRDAVQTTLTGGRCVESDAVLLAVGRIPCTQDLGLEVAGVQTNDAKAIPTESTMQTNIPHIYAVGDVGVRASPVDMALVHVAQAEGRRAVQHIIGEPGEQNMDHVPYVIFTIPMIAGAGLNETVARARYKDVRIGKYPYGRNHRAHTMFPPIGFVKLIVGPEGDDRILGVRAVGRDADSIVAAASIMIERQLSFDYLIRSIMPHPSLMECLQGAAHIINGDALGYEEGEEYDYGDMQPIKPD